MWPNPSRSRTLSAVRDTWRKWRDSGAGSDAGRCDLRIRAPERCARILPKGSYWAGPINRPFRPLFSPFLGLFPQRALQGISSTHSTTPFGGLWGFLEDATSASSASWRTVTLLHLQPVSSHFGAQTPPAYSDHRFHQFLRRWIHER